MSRVLEIPQRLADVAPTLAELIGTANEQSEGIRMLIDLVTQLDKRVRWLELQERKRSRVHAKLVDVNGEGID